MPTKKLTIRVKTLGNMAWTPVEIEFDPNAFINSRNWDAFFQQLAENSLIGEEIISVKYFYPLEQAKKDAANEEK